MLDEALLNTLALVRALKGGLEWLNENGENAIDLPKNHGFFQEVQNLQHQRQIDAIQPPAPLPRIAVADFPAVEQNPNVWTEQKPSISFADPPPQLNNLNQKLMQMMVKPIGLTAERLQIGVQAHQEYLKTLEEAKNPKRTNPSSGSQQFWAKSNGTQATTSHNQLNSESLQKAQNKLDQFLTPQAKISTPLSASISPISPISPIPSIPSISEQSSQSEVPVDLNLKEISLDASKFVQISQINTQIQKCQSCFRCQSRVVPVVGQGSLSPIFMFVDAYPKEMASLSGILLAEPEVLTLFSKLLDAIGLNRHQIYLTSVLKCSADLPRSLTNGTELQACSPYFWQELSIVQPKHIIALGAMTHDMIYPEQNTFSKHLGQNLSFINPQNPDQKVNYTPIPHPLDLLIGGQDTKLVVWQIFRRIANHYGLALKTTKTKT